MANSYLRVSSALRLKGRALKGITTTNGVLAVDAAAAAAGAHSKSLANSLGDDIPLDTERGYHIVIANPEAAPRIPDDRCVRKIFIATLWNGISRVAGTVEFAGLTAAPNWKRAHVLYTHARKLLPALAPASSEERYSKWMGFRPSIPDLVLRQYGQPGHPT